MRSRGQTSPDNYDGKRLRKVDVPLVKRSDCEAAYHQVDEETGHKYGYPDKTPIIHTASGAVIGLVSFGMPCGEDGAPGVCASVSGLKNFIEEHMG